MSYPGIGQILYRSVREIFSGRFQSALYLFYTGCANHWDGCLSKVIGSKRYECSCCNYRGYAFVHLTNESAITMNSACPECGSRSRHRALTLYFVKAFKAKTSLKVLHFAPEPVLKKSIIAYPNISYQTADLYLQDVDFPGQNLEALSLRDNSFDVIICNHVLEHIKNDKAAIKEISRILTSEGQAMITIPGDWKREETIEYKKTSSNGHWRDYGLNVMEVFSEYFSQVEAYDLSQLNKHPENLSYGIKSGELLFVCSKKKKFL